MITLADHDAEQAILGAMMLSVDAAELATERLSALDFHDPANGAVFAAVATQLATGQPTDPLALAHALEQTGNLTRAGGRPYLHTLYAAMPITGQATHYLGIVSEFAQRRRLGVTAVRLGALAADLGRPIGDIVNAAQADLHAATVGRSRTTVTAFGDGLAETIEEICSDRGRDRGLSTGIGILDDVIGGLKPGQLIIIGGRPGAGKSVLAIDMARATAIRAQIPTLVISLEMSVTEVRMRVCAAECKINLHRILNGGLHPDEKARLRGKAPELGATPLHVDENAGSDIGTIRTAARRIQQQHGLGLLIVDYLQLMTSTTTSDSRAQEVAAISRGLKLLAKELGIPIVAAAQLNRASEQRSDRRPMLSDLRESGSIEADADIVILLHRPDYHDPESARSGEIDLIVCKNRNGPQETVTAAAQLEYARIVDMEIP